MDDETEWGPAMRALTEQQRRFVLAMAAAPFGDATKWARAAGYSDKSGAAKVSAFRNMHDPKIEAAVQEFAAGQLNTVGPLLATFAMLRIAKNPRHPKHLKAVEMVANRVGLHERTEHRVTVDHTDKTGLAMIDRIKAAAAKLGVDPAVLLGENAAPAMKVIEGTVEKVDGR